MPQRRTVEADGRVSFTTLSKLYESASPKVKLRLFRNGLFCILLHRLDTMGEKNFMQLNVVATGSLRAHGDLFSPIPIITESHPHTRVAHIHCRTCSRLMDGPASNGAMKQLFLRSISVRTIFKEFLAQEEKGP